MNSYDPTTLRTLLEEARLILGKQLATADSHDTKAGIVIGAASLASAWLSGTQGALWALAIALEICSVFPLTLLVIAIALYVLAVYCAFRAILMREFAIGSLELSTGELKGHYVGLSLQDLHFRLLKQYADAYAENQSALTIKAKYLRHSIILLAVEVIYLVTLTLLTQAFAI